MCPMALDIGTSDAVALNAKIKASDGSKRWMENVDGSECQDWEVMMALNAETKKW